MARRAPVLSYLLSARTPADALRQLLAMLASRALKLALVLITFRA